ncbi:MAG: hypothetical protein J6J36_07910 [Clostridia bacterium]|nr:hypothetical protein [Clostridia bacterium]
MNSKETTSRIPTCENVDLIYACEGNFSFDHRELYNFVAEWLSEAKLNFAHFAGFMKALGLCLPAKFTDYDYLLDEFSCTTNSGKIVRLRLYSANNMPYPQITLIRKLGNGNTDELTFDVKKISDSLTAKLYLSSRSIDSQNRFYEVSRYEGTYSSSVYIKSSGNTIRVCILPERHDEPKYISTAIQCALQRLEKSHEFADFMLNFDTSDESFVDKIFHKVLEILNLPIGYLNKFCCISVCDTITSAEDDERCELGQILFCEGEITRYAKLEDGKIYDVSCNGDWQYLSDNLRLVYSHHTNKTRVTCLVDSVSDELRKVISEITKKTLKLREELGENSSLLN